jgi:hypothetical protein
MAGQRAHVWRCIRVQASVLSSGVIDLPERHEAVWTRCSRFASRNGGLGLLIALKMFKIQPKDPVETKFLVGIKVAV